MANPRLLQASEAVEGVGIHERSRCRVMSQERDQGYASEIRDDRHASAPGCTATLLHGDHDEGGLPAPQLSASPQTRLDTPNPALVHFHFPTQRLSIHVDHGLPQLV